MSPKHGSRRTPVATRDEATSVLAGRRPVLELLAAEKVAERILIAHDLKPSRTVTEIRRRAEALGVPVRYAPRSELDGIARDLNHQGVVAVTGRYRYAPLESLVSVSAPALLFLDGVTDPHNLGSLLRSADAAGFDGIVIPARRAAGVTAAVRRVSAGASEIVPVARVGNLARAIDEARGAGLWIVGLDGGAPDSLWDTELVERPVGLVLGAEDRGLSAGVRGHCDTLVRIPQAGALASLNVAVAGALAMFETARRGGRGGSAGGDSATL